MTVLCHLWIQLVSCSACQLLRFEVEKALLYLIMQLFAQVPNQEAWLLQEHKAKNTSSLSLQKTNSSEIGEDWNHGMYFLTRVSWCFRHISYNAWQTICMQVGKMSLIWWFWMHEVCCRPACFQRYLQRLLKILQTRGRSCKLSADSWHASQMLFGQDEKQSTLLDSQVLTLN